MIADSSKLKVLKNIRSCIGRVEKLLSDGNVWVHPLIVGETIQRQPENHSEILDFLHTLPTVQTVTLEAYRFFIESHGLSGVGIGFVDVHLLAAAKMSRIPLWTGDKCLRQTALKLGISF